MVFSWAYNVLCAGSMCLVTFSVIEKTHSLPTTLYAIPYPQNYTCTDCCDLLTCMGPGKKITSDLFELLCSKTSVATSPTCYTEHNLNHCSYTEKFVSILPSTVMIAEFFTQFCKQKEEVQAVTFCLKNSSEGVDAINRCSSPYMYDVTYIFSDICDESSIAISPTCFTKHNLNHCTNMKRLVPLLPSTDKIAEEFPQFCKQKEDMKAIQSCLTNSIVGVDVLDRCTTPYMNGLKDINSTVCETTDIMTQCVLAVLKITNCSDMIGKNYEQSMKLQKQYNPLCANASAQMCTVLYIIIISSMLMWNKML